MIAAAAVVRGTYKWANSLPKSSKTTGASSAAVATTAATAGKSHPDVGILQQEFEALLESSFHNVMNLFRPDTSA